MIYLYHDNDDCDLVKVENISLINKLLVYLGVNNITDWTISNNPVNAEDNEYRLLE